MGFSSNVPLGIRMDCLKCGFSVLQICAGLFKYLQVNAKLRDPWQWDVVERAQH
jgi:hypothetical protein